MEIQLTSTEIKEILHPKNTLKLLSGLAGLFFEKYGTPTNGHKGPAIDDLTIINGIGPTFAKRLQSAGLQTFADIANSTPEHLREVAKVAEWQGNPADWIEQAKAIL